MSCCTGSPSLVGARWRPCCDLLLLSRRCSCCQPQFGRRHTWCRRLRDQCSPEPLTAWPCVGPPRMLVLLRGKGPAAPDGAGDGSWPGGRTRPNCRTRRAAECCVWLAAGAHTMYPYMTIQGQLAACRSSSWARCPRRQRAQPLLRMRAGRNAACLMIGYFISSPASNCGDLSLVCR